MSSLKVWMLAIGLFFIFEGIVPFAAPGAYLKKIREIARIATPENIRMIGFILLFLGVVLLWTA